MKNNTKKAPIKFREDLLYFQHFMLIFVFASSDILGEARKYHITCRDRSTQGRRRCKAAERTISRTIQCSQFEQKHIYARLPRDGHAALV